MIRKELGFEPPTIRDDYFGFASDTVVLQVSF
jgi:hypothetical protein